LGLRRVGALLSCVARRAVPKPRARHLTNRNVFRFPLGQFRRGPDPTSEFAADLRFPAPSRSLGALPWTPPRSSVQNGPEPPPLDRIGNKIRLIVLAVNAYHPKIC
jgi:hypothetical protein